MVTGSIRKVIIDGIPFNVAADANFSKTPSYSKEAVPHSGGNGIKKMRQHGNVESVTLICSSSDYVILKEKSEAIESFGMSFTEADGSEWVSPGHISLDNHETEEGRIDVTMIPDSGSWNLF
jgi:hypothetical protein